MGFIFMEEVFKDVVGYEGLYMVSNLGNIKSMYKSTRAINKDTRYLKKKLHNGYEIVNLYKNKKQNTVSVHRLVAEAFLVNTKNKKCVNHKDFNKSNNNLDNLEWATHRENLRHKNAVMNFTSKYFGVCFDKSMNKWYAGITHNKKQKLIGYFDSEYEAHLSYEKELTKLSELT